MEEKVLRSLDKNIDLGHAKEVGYPKFCLAHLSCCNLKSTGLAAKKGLSF